MERLEILTAEFKKLETELNQKYDFNISLQVYEDSLMVEVLNINKKQLDNINIIQEIIEYAKDTLGENYLDSIHSFAEISLDGVNPNRFQKLLSRELKDDETEE